MAGSLNKVMLIGNLGADPELRALPSGGKVASFRIATSERWTDKTSAERRERVEWHSIVVFNENLVKVIEQYLKKGQKVYVEGQLQTRKWQDKEGVDRYSTEVVLQGFNGTMTMLDRAQSDPGRHDYSGHERDAGGRPAAPQGGANRAPASGAPAAKPQFDKAMDDEIPF